MLGFKESFFRFFPSVYILPLLLYSCADEVSDSEGEDRSTPYVASINPADGATGVSSTDNITITFSKPIPPKDVTYDSDGQCLKNVQISSDNFSTCLPLSNNGGDRASKVFVFAPNTFNSKIPSGTKYSVKILSTIKDYYEKAMDADKTSTFTTETRCSSGCSWSRVSSEGDLTGRSGHSGLVFNKKIWINGGFDNISYFQDVMSSDNGSWDNQSLTGTVWGGRNEHVSLLFKGKMWILGGKNTNGAELDDVWSSSTGLSWDNQTLSGDIPSARHSHAGVIFKNKMWILGGQSGSSYLNDVFSSSDGAQWSRVTDNASWLGRYGHAAVVYDNKIWIMGGNDNSSGDFKDVWTSSDGETWHDNTSTTNVTWSGMKEHSAQVFDGKIWILGGNDNGSTQQKFYFYPTVNGSWSSTDNATPLKSDGSTAWSQRSSLTSFDFDNYLWVVGGDNGTAPSRHMKDVWKYGK